MPSSILSRSILALAVGASLTLTACGTSDSTTDADASAGIVEDGAYPASIDHAYGTTVVEDKPARVVTIGWSSQDVVLALGTAPVGMERFEGEGIENDILPWDVEPLNGSVPELLTTNPDVPFEQILALQPDLVVAVYSGITQETYDRLADIAPTIAFPDEPWATTIEDQTTMIGAALGRPAAASDLLADFDQYFVDSAESHPQFAGNTITFGMYSEAGMIVFCPVDPRIELLERLGFESSPGVVSACATGDSSVSIAGEEVDTLDADVMVLVDADGTVLDQALAFEPFARLSAVSEGRLVRQVGMDYAMATSAPTVLSIPYAFDKFIAQLDDALA
jgi:iron complex transport system substrate-binding protein